MNKHRKHKRSGFTLVEILIVVVILALVAVLVIPRILGMINKSGKTEGLTNLGAIRSAELLLHDSLGRFKLAGNLSEINAELGLLIGGRFYHYQVIEASDEDFLALAIPNFPGLEPLAIRKDGFVTSPFSGGGGGTTSGSTGGGGGGGSGGGGSGGGGSSGGVGSGSIFVPPSSPTVDLPSTTSITSPTVPVPTGLQLISNDGWLTMGWTNLGSPFSYKVYQSDSVDGTFVVSNTLFDTSSIRDSGWEDAVVNGVTTCYRVTAIGVTTTGQVLESQPSAAVCGQASATSPYSTKTAAGLTALGNANINIQNVDGVPTSDTLSNRLVADGIPILFGTGPGENGALAWFNPNLDTITIDTSFFGSPDEVIATLLAHEAMHHIWNVDYQNYQDGLISAPTLGTPPTPPGGIRSSNSLDQEYRSLLTNSQVWYNIRGSLTDDQLDFAMGITLNGNGSPAPEDIAKALIRLNYPGYADLPDY